MIESLIVYIAIMLTVGFVVLASAINKVQKEITKLNTEETWQEQYRRLS